MMLYAFSMGCSMKFKQLALLSLTSAGFALTGCQADKSATKANASAVDQIMAKVKPFKYDLNAGPDCKTLENALNQYGKLMDRYLSDPGIRNSVTSQPEYYAALASLVDFYGPVFTLKYNASETEVDRKVYNQKAVNCGNNVVNSIINMQTPSTVDFTAEAYTAGAMFDLMGDGAQFVAGGFKKGFSLEESSQFDLSSDTAEIATGVIVGQGVWAAGSKSVGYISNSPAAKELAANMLNFEKSQVRNGTIAMYNKVKPILQADVGKAMSNISKNAIARVGQATSNIKSRALTIAKNGKNGLAKGSQWVSKNGKAALDGAKIACTGKAGPASQALCAAAAGYVIGTAIYEVDRIWFNGSLSSVVYSGVAKPLADAVYSFPSTEREIYEDAVSMSVKLLADQLRMANGIVDHEFVKVASGSEAAADKSLAEIATALSCSEKQVRFVVSKDGIGVNFRKGPSVSSQEIGEGFNECQAVCFLDGDKTKEGNIEFAKVRGKVNSSSGSNGGIEVGYIDAAQLRDPNSEKSEFASTCYKK